MATNLARGGGKAYKPIVDQLKDLEKQLKGLQDQAANKEAVQVVSDTAQEMYDDVVASAQAAHIPQKAMEDIFFFAGQQPNGRRITALVGLRKRGRGRPFAHGYVEWNSGRQRGGFAKTSRTRRRGQSLVISGTRIGENLGTMWELGTTKMKPRPFFGVAIDKNKVIDVLTVRYRKIVEDFVSQ